MAARANWQQPKTVKLMVELDANPRLEQDLDRGAKYRFLVDDNRHKRREIIDWLRNNSLADSVVGMGDATAFNILFLETTRNIASRLRNAPHVVHVSKVDNIAVDLLTLDQEPIVPEQWHQK